MLGSTIQREIAEVIQRELRDPRLPTIISVTRVKVSNDLEFADVYISTMGTPGQQGLALNALKHSAGLMRTRLTKNLSLRVAPFLRFHNDEGLKKEMQVLDLLEVVRRENEEIDRKRAAEAEGAAAANGVEPSDAPQSATPANENDQRGEAGTDSGARAS